MVGKLVVAGGWKEAGVNRGLPGAVGLSDDTGIMKTGRGVCWVKSIAQYRHHEGGAWCVKVNP